MAFAQGMSGMVMSDEVVKGAMSGYVFEHMEIASYTILIAAAKAAGASGFITKEWGAADVIKAVRMVALGSQVYADEPATAVSALSDREMQVLDLISEGATNREIADQLHLSPHTIKEHTSAIYRKLEVRNRAEAVRQAQRLRLIS